MQFLIHHVCTIFDYSLQNINYSNIINTVCRVVFLDIHVKSLDKFIENVLIEFYFKEAKIVIYNKTKLPTKRFDFFLEIIEVCLNYCYGMLLKIVNTCIITRTLYITIYLILPTWKGSHCQLYSDKWEHLKAWTRPYATRRRPSYWREYPQVLYPPHL